MLALSFNARAQNVTFDPHYTGPYPNTNEKFFVRLYVVYWQNSTDTWADNLGTAELERRTARTFALLNQAFNPHDIFLVPGEIEPGSCNTVLTLDYNEERPEYSDGIAMFVFSDDRADIAKGQVYSETIPAGAFYVEGEEGDDPGSTLPVVPHELGHCFGLAHTFYKINTSGGYFGPDASCTGAGVCESGFGSDSDQCCGDMVKDTPAFGFSNVTIANDCSASETPTGLPPDFFKNYMSYSYPTRCRDRFTKQQGDRMRLYLKNSSLLAPFLIESEEINVGSPTTWNTPQSKFSNIEVPNGATLIVDDVLEIAPGTYIVVRRGGTLIVNSTITAGCGGMWGGIVVEGHRDYPQKESNGQPSSAQGRVVLNSSGIVEHALCGIAAHGYESPGDIDFAGGIVEVYGRIRNCVQGLRLDFYRRLGLPNASVASGAFFTLDDNYRGDLSIQPVLLNLRNTGRLDVSGTWLNDNRTQNCIGRSSRARGIVAEDAALRVRTSHFRSLDRGILCNPMEQVGGEGAYEVENSSFFDCYTGIESDLPDNFRIVNNYFKIGRPSVCPDEGTNVLYAGVRLQGYDLPEGIVLANNQFKEGNRSINELLSGVDCLGTGSEENFIRKNYYQDLTFGNHVGGNNGGATGLRFECNEHVDNGIAHQVLANSSVRGIQGDVDADEISTAAGNSFNGNGYTWMNAGGPVTYYYLDSDASQSPSVGLGFVGITKKEATYPNPNCSTLIDDCPPPCAVEDSQLWKDQFFPHKTSWLTKKAQFDNLTDTAAQATLLLEIIAHRSAMDHWGGLVIRDFALDSTGTRTDSVLLWIRYLHAYETDLRLARHTFFSGDMEDYDAWLDSIPVRNDLSEAQADELADFADMLAVVRPYVEAGANMYALPTTVLGSLETWAGNCNEPGFVAKVILLRNGRESTTHCGDTVALRPAPILSNSQMAGSNVGGLKLYPNPTQDKFYVELPLGSPPAYLTLHRLDGRMALEQVLTASATINAADLPSGMYVCRIVDQAGVRLVAKLLISR